MIYITILFREYMIQIFDDKSKNDRLSTSRYSSNASSSLLLSKTILGQFWGATLALLASLLVGVTVVIPLVIVVGLVIGRVLLFVLIVGSWGAGAWKGIIPDVFYESAIVIVGKVGGCVVGIVHGWKVLQTLECGMKKMHLCSFLSLKTFSLFKLLA